MFYVIIFLPKVIIEVPSGNGVLNRLVPCIGKTIDEEKTWLLKVTWLYKKWSNQKSSIKVKMKFDLFLEARAEYKNIFVCFLV